MGTTMHRLQVSLPPWQVQFLAERAEKEGVSIAEIIRRLIQNEAESSLMQTSAESLWAIAGIAEDHGFLLGDVPVSERPGLYVAAAAVSPRGLRKPGTPARRSRKNSQKP
jgi:hypothetical protein